ncbi:MFS transporter [Arthrobacter sulfonylureivorans]|uniref:MFS transporter n=2 Tax=Arthrobacter sulfonylureivorans TaxID=2486855 RepID=A0ABY3W9S1_9MICC|nr:MFS transporter [Arthrobacter sulfonylureivorans]UNK45323.1 MFS transporter [Arthrobacter sulfonylureivorans]
MNEPTEPNQTSAVMLKEHTLHSKAPAERTNAEQAPAKRTSADGDLMSHKQILQVLTGLLAALFTAMLSSTIVGNALPTIIADLHGTQTDFAWVVTAALLANAATTPIWGKFADLYNKKLLVQLSIVIFVAGSVLAGFAPDMTTLLAARVVQGTAMGGLTALVQAIIGTVIPPRERGRYAGYMGAVMAVATAGGPLLGGFIVDSPLGWRWTFFVCVPLAVIALLMLQKTLKMSHERRHVKIDWLGSVLLTAGVSILLIWVSFAGQPGHYEWLSGTSALMVGIGVVLLAVLVWVESKAAQPIIPLKIITERTTALSIIASISVGVAMFGSATFVGQYFQVARGATPTEAGLLMLPMVAGNLIGATVSGQLITRYGKWKRFLVIGAILVISGTGLAGMMDHQTSLWLAGIFLLLLGLGMGLLMQNLVLGVQNTVRAKDIGAASASVAFFRSFGGAIGVSVLGAVLAGRVNTLATAGMQEAGIPVSGDGAGATLDFASLPPAAAEIMRSAYGDGTALIFQLSAVIAVVALIAVLFIKERPLRRTIDIKPTTASPVEPGMVGGAGPVMTGSLPVTDGARPTGGGQPDAAAGGQCRK